VRHLVSAVGARDVGICRCAPDETATLELPGGFGTVASIYRGRGDGARPGVLLVHGNTWLGRRLSTYRVKARLLADAGYTVLAYDQVGFGEADDRFQHGRDSLPAAYDALAQAAAALAYLRSMDRVDPNDITALGHSGGVDAALRIAQAHAGVTRVVIMVAPPPPLPDEQSVRARGRYFQGRAERTYSFIHGRDWPEWFSWELTGRGGEEPDPFEPYREPGHPPLLLVLGENDEPRGHETVRARFDDVAGEKRLAFIPSSDHYLNTAQSLGLVFYHRQVARDFRDEVVTWLSEVES
jgi:pimeloyl-ACP methyl ester carboxylesterase